MCIHPSFEESRISNFFGKASEKNERNVITRLFRKERSSKLSFDFTTPKKKKTDIQTKKKTLRFGNIEHFQEARGSTTLFRLFRKKRSLDETLSERKSRAGQKRRCRSTRGSPFSLSLPSLVGKIFSVFTVHRSLARERVPVKEGGKGGGKGGGSREGGPRSWADAQNSAAVPFVPAMPRLFPFCHG